MFKLCNTCGVKKTLSCFHRDHRRNKLRPKCKECTAQYRKQYVKDHREQVNAAQRAWRVKNPVYDKTYRLHVPWNLQLLIAADNLKKSNILELR